MNFCTCRLITEIVSSAESKFKDNFLQSTVLREAAEGGGAGARDMVAHPGPTRQQGEVLGRKKVVIPNI